MNYRPLITVITPCYDDVGTLPMALASLRAQTVGDWECIVVDDGSAVPVQPVVEAFGDGRVRLRSFSSNQGRSVARQAALDMARGQFVCMLDADDWYYPDKLERQLRIFEKHPELAAVTMALAVFDEEGDLRGVRSATDEGFEIWSGERRRPPQIPFPPVMLRRDVADGEEFDPRLQRTQDADYLMRTLAGRKFGVMGQVGYAYFETWSPRAMEEARLAFYYQRMTFARDFGSAPVAMGAQYVESLIKSGFYRAADRLGAGRWLFERRNREPTVDELARFLVHRHAVEEARQCPSPTHRPAMR